LDTLALVDRSLVALETKILEAFGSSNWTAALIDYENRIFFFVQSRNTTILLQRVEGMMHTGKNHVCATRIISRRATEFNLDTMPGF